MARIQALSRRDWARENPVLAEGELGYERVTGKIKVGNGVSPWKQLPYYGLSLSEIQKKVDDAVTALVDGAPGTLDTLNEIAEALQNDESLSATLITSIAGKQPLSSELTAIAALTTTSYGRAFLVMADASAAKIALSLTKADVGLSDADNTSDANKPVSTAQAAADSAAVAAAQASSLQKSANLSDLASPATSRTNLGLGSAATQSSAAFDAAGAAAFAQASSLQKSSNLGDLASPATSRTNLGVAPLVPGAGANATKAPSASSATGTNAVAFGASTNATGQNSLVEGDSANASGINSHAEGDTTLASGQNGHAEGQRSEAVGQNSHAQGSYGVATMVNSDAMGGGAFANYGDCQTQSVVMSATTTNATPYIMRSVAGGSVAFTPGDQVNQLVLTLALNAMRVRVMAVAHRTDVVGSVASFNIDLTIARDATNGARIVGSQLTSGTSDASAAAWTLVASIDNTNKALVLTATGEAGKTIRWSARVDTVEIG